MPDPCPCDQHKWTTPVQIASREAMVSLGVQEVTDIISAKMAQELEDEGVLKVEDLPLFLGKGPARVWTRCRYPEENRKVLFWQRTCSKCGFGQETYEGDYVFVPIFRDPTPEENYVSKDGTVYA